MFYFSSNPPKSNLTKGELSSIKTLKDNKDIIILSADKGKAASVWIGVNMRTVTNNLMSNEKTYRKLKKDPKHKHKDMLKKMLRQL